MTTDLDQTLADLGEALGDLADSGREELADRLALFITAVAKEAKARKAFSRDLLEALSPQESDSPTSKRPHRRRPGPVNPFKLYESGEDELRRRLSELNVEQLKDIIAEHAMDRDKLAMKWKTPERLVERIVETVKSRVAKGEAFRR